jgi:ferredoxin-NADP reductase
MTNRGDKRPLMLFYGSKDWDSTTLSEELEALRSRLDLKHVHVLADPPQGWSDAHGRTSAAPMGRHLPPPYASHEYFICGSNPMIDAVAAALGKLGVPNRDVNDWLVRATELPHH